MKQDSLFKGAIVLARSRRDEEHGRKRSRCVVIRSYQTGISTLRDEAGYIIIANNEDIEPAKITPKSLIGLGFKSKVTYCNLYGVNRSEKGAFCLQYIYNGPEDIRIALKGGCKLWSSNVMFDDRCNISKMHSVSYIHQVQKIINQQK